MSSAASSCAAPSPRPPPMYTLSRTFRSSARVSFVHRFLFRRRPAARAEVHVRPRRRCRLSSDTRHRRAGPAQCRRNAGDKARPVPQPCHVPDLHRNPPGHHVPAGRAVRLRGHCVPDSSYELLDGVLVPTKPAIQNRQLKSQQVKT